MFSFFFLEFIISYNAQWQCPRGSAVPCHCASLFALLLLCSSTVKESVNSTQTPATSFGTFNLNSRLYNMYCLLILQQFSCLFCPCPNKSASDWQSKYLLFRSIRKSAESVIWSYSLYQWTCKVGVARMRHSNTTNWPFVALMFCRPWGRRNWH